MEDDCLCEYDSTWDTESDGDDPAGESQPRRSSQDKNKSSWALWHSTPRNMRAAKDMQNYRRGYPNLTDDECSEDKMNNLKFYLNQFPSAPDDIHIDFFHKEWKNDYKRLERVHSYIQWLFPLREPGVNYMASELTKKEIEAFKKNDEAKQRLVESYELMLGFYGIQLVNRETGEVRRAENWKERFVNLERNMHNNLRITRILKSVGELGFEHFQAPLVQFFLEETLVKKNLSSVKRSVLDYFLFAVLDKKQRQNLLRFAYLHFEPKDKFVWCPRKIQKQFKKAEKKPEVVGNGDARDEVSSRATRKDGEAIDPQQEDNVAEAKKGTHKDILSEGSPELKREAVESTEHSDNTCVENGNCYNVDNDDNKEDCTDKTSQMDQSPSPDTLPVNAETSKLEDSVHEPMCNIQTEGELELESESKKQMKKDSNALPSNGSAASPDGQMEEKDASNNPSILVSTPLKTRPECSSKHSPSFFLEREGKIPRTEFSDKTVGMEEEAMPQERVLETPAGTDKCLDRQSNGKDSENMEVEFSPPSSEEKVADS